MHEFSIAEALIERVAAHVPAGTHATTVRVTAGPLRGIDPDALDLAWTSMAASNPVANARLELTLTPWTLVCADCGEVFEADSPEAMCHCGSGRTGIQGGDELLLTGLEVDDDPTSAGATK